MTILLQSVRDSISLQSRTAPEREPLQPSGSPSRRRNWCERYRRSGPRPQDTGSASQTQPFVSARAAAGTLYWGLAPRFPAHPQRQPCPRVQTGARSGPRGLKLPGIGVSSYGPALEGMRLPLQRRSRSLLASFLAEQPTRRKSSFQNLHIFQTLMSQKAQANYACSSPAWAQPQEKAA